MVRNILIALLLFLTGCDEDDRHAAAPPPPAPPTPAAQIAIFGDSIIQILASGSPVAPFDRALNAGVGGQTSVRAELSAYICSDQGPKFIAQAVKNWNAAVGARTAYIERDSPWENGIH